MVVVLDVRYIARDVEAFVSACLRCGIEVDKPMQSIESPTTTQPTEDATAEGALTELLGPPQRARRARCCRA
jgi:hypothetical protein